MTHRQRPPIPAPGFRWHEAPWGWQLQSDLLSPLYSHGWSTTELRLEGTSTNAGGWEQVAAALRVDPHHLHRLRQVHGAAVYRAGNGRPARPPQADIAIAGDHGAGLAVQTADCVALLTADLATGAMAASHAGWRGTVADVAGVTVRALRAELGARAADLVAAIGPSIGPCCYQVGAEVRETFVAQGYPEHMLEAWFETRRAGLFLDLWAATIDLLVRAGVERDRIAVSRLCTACHPGWFPSYRRDGAGAGRLAAYIGNCRLQIADFRL